MKVHRLPPLALAALAAVLPLVGAQPESKGDTLTAALHERRLAEVLRLFEALPHPTAEDQYLVGFALIDLHRPLDADAPLSAARAAGFRGWKDWPDVDRLLDRVETCRRLAPPPWTQPSPAPDPTIAVNAGPPTSWSAPVLAAVPEFAAIGKGIFGKDLPPIRLYLFADRARYDRFYEALFGARVPTAWQDGTGNLNVVVFCETDREGKTARTPGAPETIGCVLHEFGHAWLGTYLMYRHGKEWLGRSMRRPWLDEGLSDCIASMREPAFLERRADWLRKAAARGVLAPRFEELRDYDAFYMRGDAGVRYWISALFVADLLGSQDRTPETIRRLLDEIGRSGTVEDAVRTVTGKDVPAAYERIVRRFW